MQKNVKKTVLKKSAVIFLVLALIFAFIACTTEVTDSSGDSSETTVISESGYTQPDDTDSEPQQTEETEQQTTFEEQTTAPEETKNNIVEETPEEFLANSPSKFDYSTVPAFDGEHPYYVVNEGNPYFADTGKQTVSFEKYSPRDSLGRCSVVVANVGKDIMPTEDRGSIGSVKPTGWQTVKYDCVDGKYLYNRCHLIGFQLTGENANEDNLITGTRYMNIYGMLPFENMVADYILETNNHVMYRATPIFVGQELVARGVLLEAYSVEDEGDGICFNVFCYNVQPQIEIDYSNGNSKLAEEKPEETQAVHNHSWTEATCSTPKKCSSCGETDGNALGHSYSDGKCTRCGESDPNYVATPTVTYVLNTKSKKFHKLTCRTLPTNNRKDTTMTREQIISQGYSPCGNCHP